MRWHIGRREWRKLATTARHPGGTRADRNLLRAQRRTRRRDELAEARTARARYHRLGGRRGQRRRFAARRWYEAAPAGFEVSTGALEAAYPFQVASRAARPAGDAGLIIGAAPTGGTFAFDPWTAYRQGRLANPNVLILGDVGSGKSALAKTLIWRGLACGRGAHVIDPKGEYAPLAAAAGTEPIRLSPGGGVVLNPLDPGAAGAALSPTALFHRNLACVRALLEATLGRSCRQLELVVAAGALARISGLELTTSNHNPQADRHGTTATLTMLAEALLDPPAEIAARANMAARRVRDESREMSLALTRLVDDHGDLGGMFAGRSTLAADALAELTVVDIAELYRTNRQALPLVMICTASWLQLATTVSPTGRWQLNDEGWALMADEGTARFTQTNQKLARQLGLSVVTVLHRLSDTAAAGAAGSTTRALAEGVIADSGTWIIYRQRPGEQPLLRDTLALNANQSAMATRLPRGRGLWIVAGDRRETTLVDHVLSTCEQTLVDTDQAMNAIPPFAGDPLPGPDRAVSATTESTAAADPTSGPAGASPARVCR
jgi:hypothetical protein